MTPRWEGAAPGPRRLSHSFRVSEPPPQDDLEGSSPYKSVDPAFAAPATVPTPQLRAVGDPLSVASPSPRPSLPFLVLIFPIFSGPD